MINDVSEKFNKLITDKFVGKEEILRFLLKHPRKNPCIEKLCKEIQIIESRRKSKFGTAGYVTVINEIAKLFCTQALTAKEQELYSMAKRKNIEAELNKVEIAENTLSELQKEVAEDQKTKVYT